MTIEEEFRPGFLAKVLWGKQPLCSELPPSESMLHPLSERHPELDHAQSELLVFDEDTVYVITFDTLTHEVAPLEPEKYKEDAINDADLRMEIPGVATTRYRWKPTDK